MVIIVNSFRRKENRSQKKGNQRGRCRTAAWDRSFMRLTYKPNRYLTSIGGSPREKSAAVNRRRDEAASNGPRNPLWLSRACTRLDVITTFIYEKVKPPPPRGSTTAVGSLSCIWTKKERPLLDLDAEAGVMSTRQWWRWRWLRPARPFYDAGNILFLLFVCVRAFSVVEALRRKCCECIVAGSAYRKMIVFVLGVLSVRNRQLWSERTERYQPQKDVERARVGRDESCFFFFWYNVGRVIFIFVLEKAKKHRGKNLEAEGSYTFFRLGVPLYATKPILNSRIFSVYLGRNVRDEEMVSACWLFRHPLSRSSRKTNLTSYRRKSVDKKQRQMTPHRIVMSFLTSLFLLTFLVFTLCISTLIKFIGLLTSSAKR